MTTFYWKTQLSHLSYTRDSLESGENNSLCY